MYSRCILLLLCVPKCVITCEVIVSKLLVAAEDACSSFLSFACICLTKWIKTYGDWTYVKCPGTAIPLPRGHIALQHTSNCSYLVIPCYKWCCCNAVIKNQVSVVILPCECIAVQYSESRRTSISFNQKHKNCVCWLIKWCEGSLLEMKKEYLLSKHGPSTQLTFRIYSVAWLTLCGLSLSKIIIFQSGV